MKTEEIAKFIFGISQKYNEIIGNYKIKDWESCPEEIKSIYYKNISAIRRNQKVKPEKLHEMMIIILFNHGWRYSAKFSEENKTSPKLQPFSKLSESQKIDYYIFKSLTRYFLKDNK